jgi:ribonuclease P protein component
VKNKPRYTLGKAERLKSRKAIEDLFSSGESFSLHPFRVYFLKRNFEHCTEKNEKHPHALQFGVGVSKKNFKKAVDRNRLKRLTREAYRLQKNILVDDLDSKKEWCLKLFLVYTSREMMDYKEIKEKVEKALVRLQSKIKE